MYRVVVVLTAVQVLTVVGTSHTCDPGDYFNVQQETCMPCTQCKSNEMMHRRCEKNLDAICFSFLKDQKFRDHVNSFVGGGQQQESDGDGNNGSNASKKPDLVEPKSDGLYWKKLAFALIAVLSVLTVMTTIVVFLTCYKFRHFRFWKRRNSEVDDAESGYVVIHQFPPPISTQSGSASPLRGFSPPSSPDNQLDRRHLRRLQTYRGYLPKRRIMNDYVDDVFESEDSAGSRSLRHNLEPIPEAES